jgi:hypothetical protein
LKTQVEHNPVRKLPVPSNFGDFVEAVFQAEICRIFSDDFRPAPTGKHTKLTGIHWKKSGQFPVEILLPCSSDFLQDPIIFSQDLVAGIIDLGTNNDPREKRFNNSLNN